jgi:hypothetical protein
MNILYILQQSIYGNDNKWKSSDSNINMMVGIFTELLKKTDWNFYILIAPIENFSDIKSYDELIKNDRINFISYNFPINAFLNRQHFNIFEFDIIFKKLPKIDIIWNNITELSRNIKTYLFNEKQNSKLITTCYWMDTPEINEPKIDSSISYQYRQFDGYECSDLCIFTCKSTKNAFFANAKLIFKKNKIKLIKNKSVIWDFGFSKNEANKYKINEKFEKTTILFLNRLSGINYTHHEEFIKAINYLYEERKDFQVIFTNPSGKYSWKDLKEKINPLYIYKEEILSREEYFNLLWKADISFHGYIVERMGGCANTESIYCNNITIMPRIFEYARRGGIFYPFYINKKINYINIKNKLNKALDNINFSKTKYFNNIQNRNLLSSFEYNSDIVIKNIKGLFNDK